MKVLRDGWNLKWVSVKDELRLALHSLDLLEETIWVSTPGYLHNLVRKIASDV